MKMNNFLKVGETLPIINGLISHIDYDFEIIESSTLDFLFITNYGLRTISPLIVQLVAGDKPTDEELTVIASIIKSYYFVKWENLKKLYLLEYDPLHNYLDKLTETITGINEEIESKNSTVTTNLTQTNDTTNTKTDNLSEVQNSTIESTSTNNAEASTFGFNSEDAVKSDSDIASLISTDTSNDSKINTGTQVNDITSTNTNGGTVEKVDTSTNDDNTTRTRISEHSGNIGNLTTQQLFKQELETRQWNFIKSVFEDIKDLITIPVYM